MKITITGNRRKILNRYGIYSIEEIKDFKKFAEERIGEEKADFDKLVIMYAREKGYIETLASDELSISENMKYKKKFELMLKKYKSVKSKYVELSDRYVKLKEEYEAAEKIIGKQLNYYKETTCDKLGLNNKEFNTWLDENKKRIDNERKYKNKDVSELDYIAIFIGENDKRIRFSREVLSSKVSEVIIKFGETRHKICVHKDRVGDKRYIISFGKLHARISDGVRVNFEYEEFMKEKSSDIANKIGKRFREAGYTEFKVEDGC